jgi:hypothetical protein
LQEKKIIIEEKIKKLLKEKNFIDNLLLNDLEKVKDNKKSLQLKVKSKYFLKGQKKFSQKIENFISKNTKSVKDNFSGCYFKIILEEDFRNFLNIVHKKNLKKKKKLKIKKKIKK